MINKKFSFAAFLTASVTSTFALNAGFDNYGNLSVSAKKLKSGFESGQLQLKSGHTFKVEGHLDSSFIYRDKEKFSSYSFDKKSYTFIRDTGGGFEFDPETNEPDYSKPLPPGPTWMNLTLTPLEKFEDLELSKKDEELNPSSSTASNQEIKEINESQFSLVKPSKEEIKEDEEANYHSVIHSQFKVIQEKAPENTPPKKPLLSRKLSNGLYVNMEHLTAVNQGWWLSRLGAEAFFEFSSEIEQRESQYINMSQEQRVAMEQSYNQFAQEMGSFTGASVSEFNILSQDLQDAQSFMVHYNNTDADFKNRALNNNNLSAYMRSSLPAAWRGFKYNLENLGAIPTWVSYISSEPVDGPAYTAISVTSPKILMAMTATISSSFYSPLGIYKSPIAVAEDKERKYANLSLLLHSATASMMGEVNPDYKYVVVRPLDTMAQIFEKSGIPHTKSEGGHQETDQPYVRVRTAHLHRWHVSEDQLSEKEKKLFGSENPYGDSPYVLVDSKSNEYTQISWDHAFSKSPFLGNITRDKIESFPFVTIKREDLERLSK